MSSKIIFFSVKNASTKLTKIYSVAQEFFQKKQRLLFIVPDQTSLEFVDTLLWKWPQESFLPHRPLTSLSSELIGITTLQKNLNSAHALFNLSAEPLLWAGDSSAIFELEDLTSPEKETLSKNRYLAYRDAGYAISLES